VQNCSPYAVEQVELDGKLIRLRIRDQRSAPKSAVLANHTFLGNDVDPKIVHLATINVTLRSLRCVQIRRRNVLTTTFDAHQRADLGLPQDGFALILANPSFSGPARQGARRRRREGRPPRRPKSCS
jgi:type I restriction enzyme M protein